MSQQNGADIAGVVHRGRDERWLRQAQQNRQRQRRRRFSIGTVVVVLVLMAAFLLDDGPRRSGLLDALGFTCGEYVVDAAASDEQIFEPWQTHADTLSKALQQRPEDQGGFDPERFREEVETVAAQVDAVPVRGLFAGWTSPSRRVSAAAIDGALVLGHHDHLWTMTDRVSVASPQTGKTQWTAELAHPLWEDWQAPERALYGVGVAEDQVLLQTPAANGDTDLVVLRTGDERGQDCVRLEGDLDPVEALQERPGAWPVTMNMNLDRLSETEFLLLHGLDEESGSPMLISEVDIDALQAKKAGQFPQAYPSEAGVPAAEAESIEVEAAVSGLEVANLKPLGQRYHLLTWEAGYIIFEQS